MKFQFSLARLLLAVAGFALVLGIMKPLRLAGNPLVWIAASAVAGIVLVATRDQFRFKGTIAISLQVIIASLLIAARYLQGPWDAPVAWEAQNHALLDAIGLLLNVTVFPLGYLAYDPISVSFLAVANCYLWAQLVCWTAATFRIPVRQPKPE
jgi:hypothetical protein